MAPPSPPRRRRRHCRRARTCWQPGRLPSSAAGDVSAPLAACDHTEPRCDARGRRYVLAHLKHIKYLDYRLVDQQAVATAKEQYQDELLDLDETEGQQVSAPPSAPDPAAP